MMRMMLAGMSESQARLLRGAASDLTADAGFLQDWTYLEQACQQAKPDVVTVYLGARPGQILALVKRVRAMFPSTAFVAVAEAAPPTLVEQLGEAGIVDLVLMPECPKDLRRAIKSLAARDRSASVEGSVITFLGAKGGMGTSVAAINVASELVARDRTRKIILVDLHVYLGDLAESLQIRPKPSVLWFLQRGAVADARTWTDAPPIHRAGFQVLGLDGDLAKADPVTAEQVVFLLSKLKERYHYVIVDCGAEVTEVSLTACSAADHRLVIMTDQLGARVGARRRRDALATLEMSPPPARAIVNRAVEGTAQNKSDIERAIKMPVIGFISNAWQDTHRALELGQTLRESAPRSQVTQDFSSLVDSIAGARQDAERRKRTFFNFFR